LGAPISDNAIDGIFSEKRNQLQLLFDRLIELDNHHIAFYILKNCFALPKLVYLLRVTPTVNHREMLEEIDVGIKVTAEKLINAKLNEKEWIESSLPVRCGGLGIRKVQDLALPAFLSSVNGTSSLVSLMLQMPSLDIMEIADYQDGLDAWSSLNPETDQPLQPSFQKQWDNININRLVNGLQFDSDEDKARVLAIRRRESGAWLHALPSRAIGTLLDNNVFRISIGLRLGIDICAEHTCVCGSEVDVKGRHGLKCKNSAGRFATHGELNAIIKRTLVSADVPARLEPLGLCRDDGKRVDGVTLIPWSRGSRLIWDATRTDTFAPSNIRFSSKEAGRAAEDKARRKERKYSRLIEQNYHFVPFAVETMGPWCAEAMKFFHEVSKMIELKTQEPRSKSFLLQRLSMAIQKGNAAAVMGTFPQSERMEEIFYLC